MGRKLLVFVLAALTVCLMHGCRSKPVPTGTFSGKGVIAISGNVFDSPYTNTEFEATPDEVKDITATLERAVPCEDMKDQSTGLLLIKYADGTEKTAFVGEYVVSIDSPKMHLRNNGELTNTILKILKRTGTSSGPVATQSQPA